MIRGNGRTAKAAIRSCALCRMPGAVMSRSNIRFLPVVTKPSQASATLNLGPRAAQASHCHPRLHFFQQPMGTSLCDTWPMVAIMVGNMTSADLALLDKETVGVELTSHHVSI